MCSFLVSCLLRHRHYWPVFFIKNIIFSTAAISQIFLTLPCYLLISVVVVISFSFSCMGISMSSILSSSACFLTLLLFHRPVIFHSLVFVGIFSLGTFFSWLIFHMPPSADFFSCSDLLTIMLPSVGSLFLVFLLLLQSFIQFCCWPDIRTYRNLYYFVIKAWLLCIFRKLLTFIGIMFKLGFSLPSLVSSS